MADIFPPAGIVMPRPDWGFGQSPENNVDTEALGDGYEYREPQGLNYVRKTWKPKWSFLDPDVGLAAYEFLEDKVKLRSVLWAHPITGVIYKVVPMDISLEWDDWGNAIFEVTFRQDFNPG